MAEQTVRMARKDSPTDSVFNDADKNKVLGATTRFDGTLSSASGPAAFSLLRTDDVEALVERAAADLKVDTAEIEDMYPASPTQHDLWALSTRRQGAQTTNTTFRLSSQADAESLQKCWHEAAQRLLILRTGLLAIPGKGTYAVLLRTSQSSRVLSSIQLNDKLLTWSFHPAVIDQTVMEMAVETIMALWKHHEPRSFLSHARFVQHMQTLQLKQEKSSRLFWYSELGDEIFQPFPSVASTTAVPSPSCSVQSSFQQPRYEGDVPFASLMKAAFAILLSQHANAECVVFGDVRPRRSHPAVDPYLIAGPTQATVPLAVNVDSTSSVKSFLERIHDQVASSAQHEQVGLAKIRSYLPQVSQSNVEFQSLLMIQPPESLALREARELWNIEVDVASYFTHALVFSVILEEGAVHVRAYFDPSIIGQGHVEQMLSHYARISEALAAATEETCCGDIQLLSLADLAPQIQETEDQQKDRILRGHESSIIEHVITHVEQQPEGCAVSACDGSLTYRELVRHANAMAQLLMDRGARSGDCVAIASEKSHLVPVFILAVLRAGAHFLLLDAEQPTERLLAQLKQAPVRIIVCSPSQRDRFRDLATQRPSLVFLDATLTQPFSPHCYRTFPDIDLDDDAYIIFTSGTTGNPKGIRITHRNVTTALYHTTRAVSLTKDDRVLQYSRYSWDVGILELLGTLLVGARICMPPESTLLSPPALEAFIHRERISFLMVTPTVVRFINPAAVPSVKTVALIGEAMSTELQERWAARTRLFNAYGPAECSIVAAVSLVRPDSSSVRLESIANTKLWAVNRENLGLLTPPGEEGELLIEGPIVGKGYIGTAQGGFCQSPKWLTDFRGGNSSQVYRTGDIVRLRSDGSLEFVGRKDLQIKISGQRVELLDIEAQVKSVLPEFETVVEAFKDEQGSTAIVAFVCCTPATCVDQRPLKGLIVAEDEAERMHKFSEIVTTARGRLKHIMLEGAVPKVFVPLHALPVSSGGKAQRSILKQFKLDAAATVSQMKAVARVERAKAQVEQLDPIQHRLRQLWARVLKIDPDLIDVDDEFSSLGGDSIKLMQLVAEQEARELGLSIPDMLEYGTIRRWCSARHERAQAGHRLHRENAQDSKPQYAQLVPLAAELLQVDAQEIEEIYPCTALQSELVALSARDHDSYWVNFTYPETLRPRDCSRFRNIWASAEALAPILRTRIALLGDESEPMQIVLKRGHNIAGADEASNNANTHSLMEGAPLLYPSFQPVTGGHVFQVRMHHSVYDGTFMDLLAGIIGDLFDGKIPEPLTPFRDFIADHDSSSEECCNFWRTQLDGVKSLSWPPRPETGYPQTDLRYQTSFALTSPADGKPICSPAVIVRTAWSILLRTVNGVEDITFGEVFSGRVSTSSTAARAAGPTITTIPVRVPVPSTSTVGALVNTVQHYHNRSMQFQQMSLHRIASLLPSQERSALDLTSLLIINSEVQTDVSQGEQVVMWEYDKTGPPLKHPYPLVLDCTLSDNEVQLLFIYDSSLITVAQVALAGKDLATIMTQLMSATRDTPIESLEQSCKNVLSYATKSLKQDMPLLSENAPAKEATDADGTLSSTALKIRDVWSAVLKKDAASITGQENFFRSGGNSISAIRLSSGAKAVGLTLSVVQIFRSPTLEGMATAADAASSTTQPLPGQLERSAPFALIDESLKDLILRTAASACDVHVQDIEDAYLCTPMQKGMLASSQTVQQMAYVQTRRFLLSSDVDVPRLFRALIQVIHERPILRTRIIDAGADGLYQVVLRSHLCRPTFVSDTDEYEETLDGVYGKELTKIVIADTTLTWIAHHATYDGDLQAVIESDIAEAYAGGSINQGIPFSKFVEHLQSSQNQSAAKDFWISYLADSVTPNWPSSSTMTPRSDQPELGHCTYRQSIPTSCSTEHTAFTQVKLALALLLRQYTESDHVLFATVLAGREHSDQLGQGPILGPTLTTVPVHTMIDGEDSLSQTMTGIQQAATDMMAFQHTGLAKVKEFVRDGVDLASDKLTLLVFQSEQSGQRKSLESLGLQELNPDASDMQTQDFPLVVETVLSEDQLTLRIHYNTTLLSSHECELFARQLAHVIGIVRYSEPGKALSSLDLVSPDERALLADWSGTDIQDDLPTPHERLMTWAQRDPRSRAIQAWDGNITYADLIVQSHRLAAHLQSRGVRPGSIVTFCMNKSKIVVLLMYAIWKAGASWTPLDSRDPESRLQESIKRLGAALFVTNLPHLENLVPERTMLLADNFDVQQLPSASHGPRLCSERDGTTDRTRPAYTLFTSGSTGTPKAVVISHKALIASAAAAGRGMGLNETSRVLQSTRFTFDPFVTEIVATLYHGGCVCMPQEDECSSNFFGTAERCGANWVALTPSVLKTQPVPSSAGPIKRMILGGEPVRPSVLSPWLERLPGYVVYGLTETSVANSCGLIDHNNGQTFDGSVLPKPFSGRFWIVDFACEDVPKLVPRGCSGELLIEGCILANGYWQDDKKTEAAFIEVHASWPFDRRSNASKKRVFRTGDRARHLPDGSVQLLGRKDHRIKISGQRVELGEVEHWLGQALPQLTAIVEPVLYRNMTEPRLTVFVVSDRPEDTEQESGLLQARNTSDAVERARLLERAQAIMRQHLPPYMVPTCLYHISRVPLNRTGKRDRATLATWTRDIDYQPPHGTHSDHAQPYATNSREQDLKLLWAEILGVNARDISSDSSFTDLGGDSISAMRLVSLARKHGMTMLVRQVLATPRLCDMARLPYHNDTEGSAEKEIRPFELLDGDVRERIRETVQANAGLDWQTVEDAYPLTDRQAHYLRLCLATPGGGCTQFCFSLERACVDLSISLVQRAVREVCRAHEVLRTFLVESSREEYYQIVTSPSAISREPCSIYTGNLEEAQEMEAVAVHQPLGMPTSRFAVFCERGRPKLLIVTANHAVYDGWSLQNLARVLKRALRCGSDPPLVSPPDYHMRDVVHRALRCRASSESADFWTQHLAPASPLALHKHDADRDPLPVTIGLLSSTWAMPSSHSTSIYTLSTAIHAALALATREMTGSPSPIIQTISTGRSSGAVGIPEFIGPAIALIPLCVQLQDDKGIDLPLEDVLKRIQFFLHAECNRHELYGMKEIATLSDHAKNACKAATTLYVHPTSFLMDVNGDKGKNAGAQDTDVVEANGESLRLQHARLIGNEGQPLVVECTPHGLVRTIKVEIRFDPNYFTACDARKLMESLQTAFERCSQASGL
ncbi:hypothetical protein CKM354_000895600 [Cercospora kikuchii]|uniref:Carrier domain-containing protein n=1 Tax=Cercospora kikuchii TaxID=84275 RepID=A0A9P3CU65_9PEZI|nr:uncharacterized protein CKM354_000895600 [Cercospora kikuchii]GIZ45805.1 hypothetical protein CKM354_000895600 [Cercospora kikuchii]